MRLSEQRSESKIGMNRSKRERQLRRVGAVGGQNKKNDADIRLTKKPGNKFSSRRETRCAASRLRIVIDEANDGKTKQRE